MKTLFKSNKAAKIVIILLCLLSGILGMQAVLAASQQTCRSIEYDSQTQPMPDTCIGTQTNSTGSGCNGGACMVASDDDLPDSKFCTSCNDESCTCTPGTNVTVNVKMGNCAWGTRDPGIQPKECYCMYSNNVTQVTFSTCN